MRKYRRDLERAHQPPLRDHRRPGLGDVLAVVDDASSRRCKEFGEKIEDGRLAGAVRADQGVNTAAPNLEIDPVHCGEPLEVLDQAVGLQNVVHALPRLIRASPFTWRCVKIKLARRAEKTY